MSVNQLIRYEFFSDGLLDIEPISPAEDALIILSNNDEIYPSSRSRSNFENENSSRNYDGEDIVFTRKKVKFEF